MTQSGNKERNMDHSDQRAEPLVQDKRQNIPAMATTRSVAPGRQSEKIWSNEKILSHIIKVWL